MADDIEIITGSDARIAVRLCNFTTGKFKLLDSHTTWLDKNVKAFVASSPNPWIDLFGYASHLGDPTFNKHLSQQRCETVMNYIADYNARALFPQDFGYGDSKSAGGRTDNDGRWRSVEVYVYGSTPPGKKPRPRPNPLNLPEPIDWYVTALNTTSMSVVLGAGFTAVAGTITFEKPNGMKYTGSIGMVGPSIGLSYTPKSGKLAQRFPGLAKFLDPKSETMSEGFLKWLLASSTGAGKFLTNSPKLVFLIQALRTLSGGSGVGKESWWSEAIGMVFGSRGRVLRNMDFSGKCLCYAITGSPVVGGFGTYVLFFGLEASWKPWLNPADMINLMSLEGKAKGFALISAASVSAQLPSLSAGATVFYGEIT